MLMLMRKKGCFRDYFFLESVNTSEEVTDNINIDGIFYMMQTEATKYFQVAIFTNLVGLYSTYRTNVKFLLLKSYLF
jgi:hypothetical protein